MLNIPVEKRVDKIVEILRTHYSDARCSLDFENALQLLIATILSAQCTDERVNKVTPNLFARFKTARDFAKAQPSELEELVRSTGFYRNKSKNIIACCQQLVEKHGGEVPQSMQELNVLPGVGRKTANCVLGNVFHKAEGIVVDTHVFRLTRRLGLAKGTNPVDVEKELMAIFPKKTWIELPHWLIYHGRAICMARRPLCAQCHLARHCPKII